MTKIVLYHGSPNKDFTPIYGYGEDSDYGRTCQRMVGI